MTARLRHDPAGPGARQDISGAVTGVIVRAVRTAGGDAAVAQLLLQAGEQRPAGELENPTSWSTHEEAVALFAAGRAVTADANFALHVGEEMLRQHDGTEVANLLRSLGSPGELLRNVAAAAAKFSTVSTMEPLEVGDAHAVVRAVARPGFPRHIDLCQFTRGLLSQVPVLFGMVPAVVAESECQARGGRSCLYSVAWEAGQWGNFVDERTSLWTVAWDEASVVEAPSEIELDEGTRAARLDDQVRQLTARLEGVYSTAADLLTSDDLEGVLSRITARAAHAVNAPRYLLVVQTAPDAPYQLHHHGFSDEEARDLAHELLDEQPDDRGGSRLIVDIASPRRVYGRLAAVYPEGMQFFAGEQQALRVYADYAATALDVVTALDEARRSDATARALLDFARALPTAASSDAVAQHLAEAVPVVTGSERSSVLLWDGQAETLSLRARWPRDPAVGDPPPSPVVRPDPGPDDGWSDGEELFVLDEVDGDPPPPEQVAGGVAGLTGDERADTEAGDAADGSTDASAAGVGSVVIHRSATPVMEQVLASRDIVVVDQGMGDDFLEDILAATRTATAVVAPLVAGDEFLGIVTANFDHRSGDEIRNDTELSDRLRSLADQAVTALQNIRLLDQVSHQAWHDSLTGLPNRRLLEDRVNQELHRGQRTGEGLCMFFVDLDRFKQVNDTLGHAAGDELLHQVSHRLCETVRRQDTVARLGGDEFAVLLPGLCDPEGVTQLARRALEALHRPYLVAGQEVHASASIGVALAPRHGTSYDELLSAADAAMYRSKGLGRDTFTLFDGEPRVADVQMETDLHHALDRGELFVLYQPFIDLQTTAVVGVEALARWRHPLKGVLEPDTFIPLAEESDLIVQIDSWVVHQACWQLRSWLDLGMPELRMAVNVSTRDLASPAFVESVVQALHETQIDPDLLELEVTERVVMDGVGSMHFHVEELRQAGVRFSIDDFGTGNSALSRIGSFPVSTLKIDRSFVQVLGPAEESTALVSAIISMADTLGVDCVAEGVETSHQSRVLLQRGCTTAQGFFFSPPLSPYDVERLLAANLARAGLAVDGGAAAGAQPG